MRMSARPRNTSRAGPPCSISLKLQVMNPARLIDIAGLRDEHGRIALLEDGLWLGALVRMSEAEDDPRSGKVIR